MTLGVQDRMFNVIQHSTSQSNCVIVTTQPPTKSVIQGKRPLAPATDRNPATSDSKRKLQFMAYSGPTPQPASVARRNARERNRVKQVNNGFAALRQHIPANLLAALEPREPATTSGRGASKKLSKVETLRLAVDYIRSLQQMLDDSENENDSKSLVQVVNEQQFYDDSPQNIAQFDTYPILPTPPSSEASTSPCPSQSPDATLPYITTLYANQDNCYKAFVGKSPEDEELLDAIFSWQQSE